MVNKPLSHVTLISCLGGFSSSERNVSTRAQSPIKLEAETAPSHFGLPMKIQADKARDQCIG